MSSLRYSKGTIPFVENVGYRLLFNCLYILTLTTEFMGKGTPIRADINGAMSAWAMSIRSVSQLLGLTCLESIPAPQAANGVRVSVGCPAPCEPVQRKFHFHQVAYIQNGPTPISHSMVSSEYKCRQIIFKIIINQGFNFGNSFVYKAKIVCVHPAW